MEIKAQQFIKEPVIKTLKNTILVIGNDDLLKDLVVEKIKEINPTITTWGDEVQLAEVLNHLKTRSLFGVQPWIIIRDVNQFVASLKKDEAQQLLSYLKQLKDQRVVFVLREADVPKTDFYKKLLEIVDIILCQKLTKQGFITSLKKKIEKEGIQIDEDTLVYLAKLLNFDLTVAKQEVEKLVAYCKDKGVILKEDVDSLIVSVSESNMFEFLEKFFSKDKHTILVAKKLMEKDIHPFQIQTFLINQIEKIFYFKVLVAAGVSFEEAFSRIKVTSNIQKVNIQKFSKLLSVDELKRLIKILYRVEINQKVYYKDIEKEFLNLLVFAISGENVEPKTIET